LTADDWIDKNAILKRCSYIIILSDSVRSTNQSFFRTSFMEMWDMYFFL